MEILGKGVYRVSEAARLTGLKKQRVREWFRGRESSSRVFWPVFQSDYPVLDDEHAISFLDLVELFVAGKLREAGISLPKLRANYASLQAEFGSHPFCRRQIYVGGKQVFTQGLNDEDSGMVIESISKQSYFDTIILPFLRRIDYDPTTKSAIRWHIADSVVLDPEIRFGKPVIEEIGMSTRLLRNSYYANGENALAVADWFGVDSRHVLSAVRFEDSLAA